MKYPAYSFKQNGDNQYHGIEVTTHSPHVDAATLIDLLKTSDATCITKLSFLAIPPSAIISSIFKPSFINWSLIAFDPNAVASTKER